MPVFVAYVKAELENVALLAPKVQHSWMIDVKHSSSDEERKEVTIDSTDVYELEGSRGVANLVIKFAGSNEKAQCAILDVETFKTRFKKSKTAIKELPRAVTADDHGQWVPILAFEARGMDVTKIYIGEDDVVVTTTSGALINENIDLSEGDWADYDEQADLSISITNLETKVEVVR